MLVKLWFPSSFEHLIVLFDVILPKADVEEDVVDEVVREQKLNKRIANKVVCKLLVVHLLDEVGKADVEDFVHKDLLVKFVVIKLGFEAFLDASF